MGYQEGEDVRGPRVLQVRMACLGSRGQRVHEVFLGSKGQLAKSDQPVRRASRVQQGQQDQWDRKVFLGPLARSGQLVHRVPKGSWVRRE
jgi:hypothetical protein